MWTGLIIAWILIAGLSISRDRHKRQIKELQGGEMSTVVGLVILAAWLIAFGQAIEIDRLQDRVRKLEDGAK